MKRGAYWPALLVGLLALGVAANLLLLVYATHDPSFAVVPDYYAKALAWDAGRAQERRNQDLGWSVIVSSHPSSRGPGWTDLGARVVDAKGAPVTGATVELDAFHHARAADVLHAVMNAAHDAGYVATLPLRRAGLWEIRLRVVRDRDTFTTTLEEELGGLP